MSKKDLMNVIKIFILIFVLIIFLTVRNFELSADNTRKDNRINELEQKVEEQYYVIDALKQ